MEILAHRGHWTNETEKNSKEAFQRAFDAGFGVETDLRDCNGQIVIAHDMPQGDEMPFEELLKLLDGRQLPLALNIKADGMAAEIKKTLEKYVHHNYFTFDMSIPEMLYQHRLQLKIFTGLSDVNSKPIMLPQAQGVWLDAFYTDWFGEAEIRTLLDEGKMVAIVSPELHRRKHVAVWEKYKHMKHPNLMLCTDYPEEAKRFFYGKN